MMRSSPWSERLFLALASLAALGSSGSHEDPPATDVTLLTPGAVIEHEAKAGETHRYSIELREGEYFEAVVEQQGVDVEETVLGPDGQTLLQMDSFSAASGPDPLAFVAPTSGRYVLAIHARDDEPPSRYVLEVEAVREPTSTDLARVRAVRSTGEAARLRGEGPGKARLALERGRQALEEWQALGDRRMEMWTALGVAATHRTFFGEFREAKPLLERALALARELGDTACEGQTLFNLGHTTAKLGLFAEARAHFEQAVALHRASGRRGKEGYLLMAVGRMLITAGDPQQALDHLHEALKVYPVAQDPGLQVDPKALARRYMGDAYLDLGEYELALAQYRLVRPAVEGHQTRDHETHDAYALTGIGSALFNLGDLDGAGSAYLEALGIWRRLGAPALEVETSLRVGDVRREEGDLPAARELFASALSVLRSQGDPVGEARAQCRLGEIHRRLAAPAAAQSAFEAALAVAPAAIVSLRVCAEEVLARLSLDAERLEAARAHAEAALEAAESFRASVTSHQTRAVTLAAQQSVYDLLIDIRTRQHDREPSAGHDVAALEVSERARARSLLELIAEGRIDVREGIEPSLLDEERSLRQRLNAEAQAQEEALVAKRNERAEALGREILALTAQVAEVQGRIRRASPRYAALTQPQPLRVAEIQRQVLDADTLLLEYALGESRSMLWVVSTDGLASCPLAPRTEIEQAARRVYETLSGPSTPWQAEVDALSRLVLPLPARRLLNRKRLLVVAPGALQYVPLAVLRCPEAIPRPDDGGSPGGANAEETVPLLARFEVVSAPSASVLATLRQEQGERPHATQTVAVFADPVFDLLDPRVPTSAQRRIAQERARLASAPAGTGTRSASATSAGSAGTLERALRGFLLSSDRGALARLPFSRQEADAILALVPQGNALKATGFAANREAATSPGLSDYRILHFATHGVLNTRQPDLSGVVLSLVDRQGRRQDGFLRLHDIYNLRLGADLVVLSGCQTGLGKAVQGEGLVGLTRGFMYAGARRVVASLWQVDDESTSELMKRFYRAMLKERRRPADALRTAQLEMSRDRRWSAPFYWAGFVLQGEWR
jgi:CHAT domain-containing protein/tetratricopeptide (TPR) repeat protein